MAERDDELEEYLRGGSRLSRAWREAGDEEPNADLDEVIIEAARREVHQGPKVAYSPFSRSWGVPLALAAVLMVSVTVTLVMQDETIEPAPVPVDGPPASQAPAVEAPPPEAPVSRQVEEARKPVPASPRKEQARPDSREREATPREAVPAPFAGQPATPAADVLRKQAAPAAASSPEEKGAATAATRAKVESADRAAEMNPEEWLARIEELRRQGKHAEAEAELAEFRKRYPDYPVEGERK